MITPEYMERDEILQRLIEIGGCDAKDEWAKGYDSAIDAAISIIENTPAADVIPVVRCKDCKYYTNNIHDPNLRDNFCNRVEQNCFDIRSPNGYCNYGEKIDGDSHAKEN